MNKQIRKLGAFLMVCYLALFLQLNRLTVFDQDQLQSKPGNTREAERDFDRPRGTISTADGVVLARSVPDTNPDDDLSLQREYPEGALFGHITGYFNPLSVGTAGLERQYNDELAGRDLTDVTSLDGLDRYFEDFFVDQEHVGNLTLTLRADVQRLAAEQLEGRRGSVVALDPRTGAILAMYSNPTYDPNPLAVHDPRAAQLASEALQADPVNPRLARAYQEIYPPGSTFKVVTATAGIESNLVTTEAPVYEASDGFQLPQSTSVVENFGGSTCGGALFEILTVSCNTAFAQMAVDTGGESMLATAEAYGFNREVPLDLPRPAESLYPPDVVDDPAKRALTGIGQSDVAATPLEMALVAAAVANGGRIAEPHVVDQIRDEDEETIFQFDNDDPPIWTDAMSSGTAALLREAMKEVARVGTAENLREGLDDFEVAGKTGTAQLGGTGRANAWIIGFAGPPGEVPQVAVAVLVEDQDGVSELTGGRVAAPIAAAILAQALQPLPAPGESAADAATESPEGSGG